MLSQLIKVFENSALYQDFIKNMPYPFNDLYFVIAISIITLALAVIYVIQAIKTKVVKEKIKRRQEAARIKRLEEEKHEKSERSELIELMRKNAENTGRAIEDDKDYIATHDVKTGVFNRASYNKALSKLNINDLVVIYADINNLKKTNDQYGKAYGDRLLAAVSKELKETFADKCYRIGGDEFVVLLSGMSEKIAFKKIEKIKENLNALTQSDADGIIYSAAFGIAVSDGKSTKQELIEFAEERMKQDKNALKREIVETYGDDGYIDERDIKVPLEDSDLDKDIMTGCLTKESFEERIRSIDETNLSIISADIDGLKQINDKLSHHAGDTVIKGFSKVLKKYFPGCVYRISDDDFCVITNKETVKSLYEKVDLVKKDLISLTENAEQGLFYSASFGISTNADNGDKLVDTMLDECLIKMREDKDDYRSGKRTGVLISRKEISNDESDEGIIMPDIDIAGIIDEKRRETVAEDTGSEKNALTSLLYSMATRQEEVDIEAEKEERSRLEREKREEILNEEIKSRYNKEDLTSHKKGTKTESKETQRVLKNEVEKIEREENKKKKGLFGKKGSDSDNNSTGNSVTGNTVNDVDIL